MAHGARYVDSSRGLLLWVCCLVSTGFPAGIGSFFGCLLVRAVVFRAFFYGFAALALLSSVILFFVGPVEGVLGGVSG